LRFVLNAPLRKNQVDAASWLFSPIPNLRSFEICGEGEDSEESGSEGHNAFNGLVLFKGNAPKLETVVVRSSYIRMSFVGLAKLSLTKVRYITVGAIRQLFTTIRSSPALRELTLEKIECSVAILMNIASTTLSLPHLQLL